MAETMEEHITLQRGIAGKKLIRTLTRDDAAVTGFPHPFRHEVFCHTKRVVKSPLAVPDSINVVLTVKILRLEVDHLMIRSHGLRHLTRNRSLIVIIIIKRNGVGFGGGLHGARCEPQNTAGVDASREVTADRYIGLQTQHNGANKLFANALNMFLLIKFFRPCLLVRKIKVPIPLLVNIELTAVLSDA